MKIIILFLPLFLLGCGNPHVSSAGPGIERTNPPLTEKEEVPACREDSPVTETRFFFGKSAGDFEGTTKCRKILLNESEAMIEHHELIWTFEEAISGWQASFIRQEERARLQLMDCEGKLIDFLDVDAIDTLGFVTPERIVCEVRLTLAPSSERPEILNTRIMR